MNEQEAIAAVLTACLQHDIKHEYSNIMLVWEAMEKLGIEDTDDNRARLEDLLTSGKWKVVYSEDTP